MGITVSLYYITTTLKKLSLWELRLVYIILHLLFKS